MWAVYYAGSGARQFPVTGFTLRLSSPGGLIAYATFRRQGKHRRAAAAMLPVVSAAACSIPARHAARVNPIEALFD
jgi:hypothetical protein